MGSRLREDEARGPRADSINIQGPKTGCAVKVKGGKRRMGMRKKRPRAGTSLIVGCCCPESKGKLCCVGCVVHNEQLIAWNSRQSGSARCGEEGGGGGALIIILFNDDESNK
jgi:hypothetical protein